MSYSVALSFIVIITVAAMTMVAYTSTHALLYRHMPMSILGLHDMNGNVMHLGKGEDGVDANGANGGTANGQAGSNSPGANGTNSVGANGNNTNGVSG